jgi:hypothetical protein
VLIVSGSIPYKTIEASDPLRLVLDLPNTVSKTMITSPVRENGVIGTVKTATVVLKPQPLTRVEIGLNQNISYDISYLQERIRVIFDKASPTPKAERSPDEEIAATKVEDPQLETEAMEKPTSTQTIAEGRKDSSPPFKTESLPPAGKILAIEVIALDEDFDVHIIGDGRLDNYDISLLPDPPRMILDLIGVKSSEFKDDLVLNGPWVRKIRIGEHPDRVRVVFDLLFDLVSKPRAELPYQIILEENRLIVSFLPISSIPAR